MRGWARRSAADAPAALAARMGAATMSFLMEVLGNKNISTAKVTGRLAQKLLPGCHRSRLFDRRAGPWTGQAGRVALTAPALDFLLPIARHHFRLTCFSKHDVFVLFLAVEAWSQHDRPYKPIVGDRLAPERFQIPIKNAFARCFQFLGKSSKVIDFIGFGPIDAKSRSLRQHGMDHHDSAAVAVKEGMAVSKIAHHFARLGGHERLVLAVLQSNIDSISNIVRVRKQDVALTNRNVRRNLFAILACPGVNGIEKNTVRTQDVTIFEMLSLGELSKGLVQPGHEGRGAERCRDLFRCRDFADNRASQSRRTDRTSQP